MELTTDFECGGGKRLSQIGEGHWRVEANGDGSGYDKYFCVQISSRDDEPEAVCRLEVHPDDDLGEAGARFFAHQLASTLGTLSAFYEINTSSQTAFEQFRRGPEVLTAVIRAIVRDTDILTEGTERDTTRRR